MHQRIIHGALTLFLAACPGPVGVADAGQDAGAVAPCDFDAGTAAYDCRTACDHYRHWATDGGCVSDPLRALDDAQCMTECEAAKTWADGEDARSNWACFNRTSACAEWDACYARCRTSP